MCSSTLNFNYSFCTCQQPWAKNRMLKVGLGFLKVLDGKVLGCLAEAQAIKLRKNKPCPV